MLYVGILREDHTKNTSLYITNANALKHLKHLLANINKSKERENHVFRRTSPTEKTSTSFPFIIWIEPNFSVGSANKD